MTIASLQNVDISKSPSMTKFDCVCEHKLGSNEEMLRSRTENYKPISKSEKFIYTTRNIEREPD